MKKIYFAFLPLLFSVWLNAQTYYPMLDSINEWSYATSLLGVRHAQPSQVLTNCSYPMMSWQSFKEYTLPDTLIGSNTYRPVINSLQNCTIGYIREDTAARKVWFLDNNSPTEKLLYNFSMQVGDTISINFLTGNLFLSGVYTLDSIGTINTLAGQRRTFNLSNHALSWSRRMVWIEGMGCTVALAYPYTTNDMGAPVYQACPGPQYEFSQFLICFHHNSKIYQDVCAYQAAMSTQAWSTVIDSCDFHSFIGAIQEIPGMTDFSIYPNPSNGSLVLNIQTSQDAKLDFFVHDIAGKQTLYRQSLGQVGSGETEKRIDISTLPDGFYLVELRSEQGSEYRKLVISH